MGTNLTGQPWVEGPIQKMEQQNEDYRCGTGPDGF